MMTGTTQAFSPSTIPPRLRPVVHLLFAVLVLTMLVVGIVSFVLYWPVGQQVCTLSVDACQQQLQFTTAQAAAFAEQGLPLALMVSLRYAGLAAGAIACLLVGLLIAWRRSDDWMAMLTALMLIAYISSNGGVLGALTRAFPALSGPLTFMTNTWGLLFILFLGLFPNGRIVPRWMRFLLPVWLVMLLSLELVAFDGTSSLPVALIAPAIVLMFGILLTAQVIRYRRFSTPRERAQVKWALVGISLVLMLVIVATASVVLLPGDANPVLTFFISLVGFNLGPSLLPIFIGIAILRSKLWDIDILIRRGLIYGLLTVSLAVVYLGSVVVLQQLFRALTGQGSDVAIIVSTLAIAALSIPLRNRIQQTIDRRFYRRKYNTAHVLSAFATTVRDEVDLGRLTDELQTVVEETMQPEHVSLWLKEGKEPKKRATS